jgi:hypothetical protein
MALIDHLELRCLIDGVVQVRLTNLSVNGQSGQQAVETLSGLSGFTGGPKRLEISGTWSVPLGGPEFDVVEATAVGSYHDVQVPYGNKSIVSRGKFTSCGLSRSTGAATECTGTFEGSFEKPE